MNRHNNSTNIGNISYLGKAGTINRSLFLFTIDIKTNEMLTTKLVLLF